MKKTIYVTLSAISGIAVIGLVCYSAALKASNDKLSYELKLSENKLSEIQATIDSAKNNESVVLQVLKKEEDCRKSHFDGRRAKPSEYRHYFSEIRAINVNDCPQDFRDAWRDFLNAVQFKIEHPVLSSGVNQSEWPSDKRRDLETIAAKYGITYRAH